MNQRDRFGLVGSTIAGTFRVDEVVAEGGFGVVYKAFHLHFRSPIALKCLKIPAELSEGEHQAFLEQFRSEAEIMFRLSASLPNIVRPLHVDAVQSGDDEFVPFMALEWLEGKSFERLIDERACAGEAALCLEELVPLLTPAALALDRAHNFKAPGETLAVVHRDVKPDNLFLCHVDGQPVVKILDFGISKVRRAASEIAGHFSQTNGQAPFSPAYGAPEQWVPKRYGQTGPWTDVWGLALTLVEIIKGDAVIEGDHQAMMGTALDPKIRPTPRNEGVAVSSEVEAVFQKALAVDPRYRYQSVREFWDALEAALRVSHATSSSQSRIRLDGPSSRLPPMSAPTPWTPLRPSRSTTEAEAPAAGLPPMLAPLPLEMGSELDVVVEPFYPNDPSSGLSPVPPALGAFAEELHVLPLDLDPEELGAPSDGPARPSSFEPPRARRRHVPTPEAPPPALEIELQPTSIFPSPASEVPTPPLLSHERLKPELIEEVEPRSVAPTVRQGSKRRETG